LHDEVRGASTPAGPDVDRLSRANADGVFAPRLKGTTSVGWKPSDDFRASVTGRYTGRYYDYTPPRTLRDFWYLDSALDFRRGRALGFEARSVGVLRLLVSGTTLPNRLPPFSTHFRGYDVYSYDLIGRTIFARVQLQI